MKSFRRLQRKGLRKIQNKEVLVGRVGLDDLSSPYRLPQPSQEHLCKHVWAGRGDQSNLKAKDYMMPGGLDTPLDEHSGLLDHRTTWSLL